MRTDPVAQGTFPCVINAPAMGSPATIRSLLPAAILAAVGDRRIGQVELSPAASISVQYSSVVPGISVTPGTFRVLAGTDCDSLLIASKSGSAVSVEVLLYTTNTVTTVRG